MNPPIYKGCGDKDDKDDIFGTLVRNMKGLGLTATEVVLLGYLLSHVSEGDPRVAPSLKEMHRATGFAPGTIHAAKRGLVGKGFIKILNERNKKRTNTYDLAPLREKIEGLSGASQGAGLPHAVAASLTHKEIEKK